MIYSKYHKESMKPVQPMRVSLLSSQCQSPSHSHKEITSTDFIHRVKSKPSWKIIYTCTSFTGSSLHSPAQKKSIVLPNGRAPCMFTSWSKSHELPHTQIIPTKLSRYLSLHCVFRIHMFPELLMEEISIQGSPTIPKIMGSCLLTPRWKCLKVHY